jgi:hypothetical protein
MNSLLKPTVRVENFAGALNFTSLPKGCNMNKICGCGSVPCGLKTVQRKVQIIEVRPLAAFHSIDSVVTGYHTYREVWQPVNAEVLLCDRQTSNFYGLQ